MLPSVVAVCASPTHSFSKPVHENIVLVAGLGVEGDAHRGVTTQHIFQMRTDPQRPNLRQVHLIHSELFEEVAGKGFTIRPGDMGENITTRGIDLLALPRGTRLSIGDSAVLEITGLRNPCRQLDGFREGLMSAVLDRDSAGELVRKSGVMAIVIAGGIVRTGDTIRVELPTGEHRRLEPV